MEYNEKFKIIQKELNCTQKEFALKLDLSPNAISQYLTGKRKPDINTIQKLIDIGISPIFLFSDSTEVFDNDYNLFIKAKNISTQNKKLSLILSEYIENEETLKKIKEKIQRAMGHKLLEKLSEVVNGDSKRMLIILYSILLSIEKNEIVISDENLNDKLYTIFEQIKFSKKDTLKLGIITNIEDYENLKEWIKTDFDDISLIELISCSASVKSIIKENLWKVNSTLIEVVEKISK